MTEQLVRTTAGATARPARPARRARSETWRTTVPTVFVLVVLTVLVALPFVNAAYVEPGREQIRKFADPARAEVTQIHVALALEGSLVNDFIDSRDPATARRYADALARETDATTRLAAQVAQLGDTARARFAEMQRLQAAWHAVAQRGLALPPGGARPPSPFQTDDYEDLLLAAARLDEALSAEIAHTQSRILAIDRAQRWAIATLALAGLVGAAAVAFLARRLRLYAAELEARRGELERAVEARARLMRGVSHDLKNPMHAIDGHAALLADGMLGPLAPAQRDSVLRIRRGVQSVLVLVEDLLELSRAEAGHLKVTLQPTDLVALSRDTIEMHRAAAQAAGHRIELSVADDVPNVVTDPERVQQVLGNLLSNAVKYTPNGGCIRVCVEPRRRGASASRPSDRKADRCMAIDVVDTGPGIPADKLDAIFDEFSRLAEHAGKPGAGLGLAIARRVARLLGGDLTAANEPQGGARFTLWLPLDRHA